jgi:hypothetical protein
MFPCVVLRYRRPILVVGVKVPLDLDCLQIQCFKQYPHPPQIIEWALHVGHAIYSVSPFTSLMFINFHASLLK